MDEQHHRLEYAKPKEKLPTDFDDLVTGLFVGRLRSKWFYWKLVYCLCLAILFSAIAFKFGANYFFFGKLSPPTPADYVSEVQEYCVPVVRAMKEFQRDHGRMPNDMNELILHYLPDQSHKAVHLYGAYAGKFEHYARWNHIIRYDFTPGDEHWEISGSYANGRIPLPPVILGPSTAATTQPTTQKK